MSSGQIPRPFIQDLVARTDIVDLIQSRVQLQKRGHNYMARCPFHDEKTPSFTVNQEKQFYYCFGCGAHGNAIGFLMEYDRLEFIAAIEYLASQHGVNIPYEKGGNNAAPRDNYKELYEVLEKANHYYLSCLRQSQKTINYLKSRGLSGEIAKQYQIGYAPEAWENLKTVFGNSPKTQQQLISTGMLIQKNNRAYDRFRDRVMFPIRDVRGRVIAFGGRIIDKGEPKYLNSPESPVFHKSNELYGLYEARKHVRNLDSLIIVEGYMDVIALAQFGIYNAVATLGTAVNGKHIQKLLRYTNTLIFCFDGDNAGRAAAWKALLICLPLLRDGVHMQFLFLDDGEDPDSMVRKIGKDAFVNRAKSSGSLSDVFFNELKRSIPLNSISDKAEFAKTAMQHLQSMPQGIFYNLFLEKLAQQLDVNVNDLENIKNHAATKPRASQPDNSANQPARRSRQLTATQRIIALILQQPALATELTPPVLSNIIAPEKNTLQTLIQELTANPELPIGQLLTLFDDAYTQRMITGLASYQFAFEPEGFKEELLAIIAKLQLQAHENQVRALVEKAKQGGLSDQERQHLNKLLTEKHTTA